MAILSGGSLTGLIPQIPTFTPPNLNSCVPDVFGLVQGGGAFSNPLAGPIAGCLAELSSILGDPGLINPTEIAAINSMVDILGTNGFGGAPGLLSHSNSLVGGMPALMANSNSLLNGSNLMNGAGVASIPSNPCELLDGIMGTVLGAANGDINAIADIVSDIISGGVELIAGLLGPIALAVSALAGLILTEIANLANFIGDLTDFSFANSIPSLANDPCLQSIFNALGTPDLINCLVSGVPNFNVF